MTGAALFVEAVLYRYRAGIPWRDLPERFGAWKAVHTRSRWAATDVRRLGDGAALDELRNDWSRK